MANVEPRCEVYGACGGCNYQDIPYAEELCLKQEKVQQMLQSAGLADSELEPITASPREYHYRNRLDLGLRRLRDGTHLFGFQAPKTRRFIEVESCPIAREEISEFIPELRKQAIKKLPANYRIANLTIKTGDDSRVHWGGIGRRSLALKEEDYFWTEIEGKRIYYSLDTFFQANLAILPSLMKKIREWISFDAETVFFDLYAGVGLFGFVFQEDVKKAVLIEEGYDSVKLMKFNANYHKNDRVQTLQGKVEVHLPEQLNHYAQERKVAMIDPPRKGLSTEAAQFLASFKQFDTLLYLSCNPEALMRDLNLFKEKGWQIKRIAPFDFFPRTQHIETLVSLCPS